MCPVALVGNPTTSFVSTSKLYAFEFKKKNRLKLKLIALSLSLYFKHTHTHTQSPSPPLTSASSSSYPTMAETATAYIVVVTSNSNQEEPPSPLFIKTSELGDDTPILRLLFRDNPPPAGVVEQVDIDSECIDITWDHFREVMLNERNRESDEPGSKRAKHDSEDEAESDDEADSEDEVDDDNYLSGKMEEFQEELDDLKQCGPPTGTIRLMACVSFLRNL